MRSLTTVAFTPPSSQMVLVLSMVLEAKEMQSHYPEAVWLSHTLSMGDQQIPHLIKSSLLDKT